MKPRVAMLAVASTLAGALAACSTAEPGADDHRMSPTSSAERAMPSVTVSPAPTAEMDAGTEASAGEAVIGTVVRFSSGETAVDVTIDQDSPAVRDFLSMLPLALTVEEFNGREKIADLPRELISAGTPGSDPDDGDLIYYAPWGNLGFYYDAAGFGYSDDVLHLGTYDAGLEQLELLEGDVTVEVAG